MNRVGRLRRTGLLGLALGALAACGARTPLRAEHVDAGTPVDLTRPADAPADVVEGFDAVEGACSNTSGGLDPLGCVFPDGTRVPFGETVNRGCVRCRCRESGSLECLAFDCPNTVTDGGRHGCVLPDGRFVESASWTPVGVTQCYCDLGTFVACRLGPCEDGGTALSPPPIVGSSLTACNDVELTPSRPPVALVSSPATGPFGGDVADGLYVLQTITRHPGSAPPSQTASVIDVRGGVWRVARFTANSAGIERANYEVGPGNALQEVCPRDTRPVFTTLGDGAVVMIGGSPPYVPTYSASGASLVLYSDDRLLEFNYARTF